MNSELLFCSIRKEWVAALPEEIVRQRMLFHMIDHKGFPASLIAVEQSLKQLPSLTSNNRLKVPRRRADIICYAKDSVRGFSLTPLMIVECKSVKLMPAIMNQVVGYNHFVGSKFIAIVNQDEIRTGWFDPVKKDYEFVNYLPSYSELMATM